MEDPIVRTLIALSVLLITAYGIPSGELHSQSATNAPAVGHLLERLSPAERANAILRIQLGTEVPEPASGIAREIEELWNSGDCNRALLKAQELGTAVDPLQIDVGFQWKQPRLWMRNSLLSTDTRIGDIDSARGVSLASSSDASILYCVISQQGDGHKGSWDLFVSTDKGDSWANTYTAEGTGNAPRTALMPTTSGLYVAYLPYFTMQRLRVMKFRGEDGTPDTLVDGSHFRDILTLSGAEKFTEIAGCTAQYVAMHVVVSTDSHVLRYFFAIPSKDDSWNETVVGPAVAVRAGLSIDVSAGSRMHGFISYVDTTGNVCLDTIHSGEGAQFGRACTAPYGTDMTSVGAYGDTIICVYDYSAEGTANIRYIINYGAGDTEWRRGTLHDTTMSTMGGVAVLRGGQGMGVYYQNHTETGWEGEFVSRMYPLGNIWTAPSPVGDYAPQPGRAGIVALGSQEWGVAYIVQDAGFAFGGVNFSRVQMEATDVAEQSGSMPAGFVLHQNYPNPFNPTTIISGQLTADSRQPTADSRVRLVVYDVLGRVVAVLADGPYPAGKFSFTFDGTKCASGVYFYRLTAGKFTAVRKMTLVK